MSSARLDAELLAARAFAKSRVELYAYFDQPLAEAELASYRALVKRRIAGEPVAYILGHKEFWSIDFEVDERVLIPRPDTETLVEQALAILGGRAADAPPARVVDVGTGSGALALALKKERPEDTVFAVDISSAALEVARANSDRLGLPVTFLEGDLAAPLAGALPLDLVVSNPPYVVSAEIDRLAPEVRREPRMALDGGSDGLAVARRLAVSAHQVLAPGGWLAIEIGAGQADAATEILTAAGYLRIGKRRDLAGIERVVFGQRGSAEERNPT